MNKLTLQFRHLSFFGRICGLNLKQSGNSSDFALGFYSAGGNTPQNSITSLKHHHFLPALRHAGYLTQMGDVRVLSECPQTNPHHLRWVAFHHSAKWGKRIEWRSTTPLAFKNLLFERRHSTPSDSTYIEWRKMGLLEPSHNISFS